MSSLSAVGATAAAAPATGQPGQVPTAISASGPATVTATATGSLEPAVVPRTANLLACKQWWRVCFLYGDQQKYYRQLYSKAAAQRLAGANQENDNANSTGIGNGDSGGRIGEEYDFIAGQLDANEDADDGIDLGDSGTGQQTGSSSGAGGGGGGSVRPLFPLSSSSPRRSKKLLRSLRVQGKKGETKQSQKDKSHVKPSMETEPTVKPKAKVTVLDDPFLFGIDADHLGDLVIRGKQYNSSEAAENLAKFYNLHLETDATAQVLEIIEHEDEPPKPALPPKQRPCPPPVPPARITSKTPTQPAQQLHPLTASDLQFLNLSLRQRSLPRSMKPFKDPHDISFTFNELDSSSATEVASGAIATATAASAQQESNESTQATEPLPEDHQQHRQCSGSNLLRKLAANFVKKKSMNTHCVFCKGKPQNAHATNFDRTNNNNNHNYLGNLFLSEPLEIETILQWVNYVQISHKN